MPKLTAYMLNGSPVIIIVEDGVVFIGRSTRSFTVKPAK